MSSRHRAYLAALLACIPGLLATGPVAPAMAQAAVTTDSAVFVERVQPDATRRLEPADRLSRGDRVITVVHWHRRGGSDNFVITNPLPAALSYQASAWDGQDVSVDGGRTWGRIGTLRIGRRFATPEDVTHVRWHISARQRSRGQIAYSGIVR